MTWGPSLVDNGNEAGLNELNGNDDHDESVYGFETPLYARRSEDAPLLAQEDDMPQEQPHSPSFWQKLIPSHLRPSSHIPMARLSTATDDEAPFLPSHHLKARRKQQKRRHLLCCSRPRGWRAMVRCCFCTVFLVFAALVILLVALFAFGHFYYAPVTHWPDPTVADLSTNTSAKFLTLNIFMRPPGVKNNLSDYKQDRLQYIIDHVLPHYDVIAIQEAFAFLNKRIDHLIVEAHKLGFNHHVASPRHSPFELAADGGLLLLSRFPVKATDTLEYPRGVHSDWLSYKGALHAWIELNATRSLHLYTTHTQASYDAGGKLNDDDTQVRLSQFARFHDFIRDTARDDGSPILLMGDFNIDAAVHNGSRAASVDSSEAYERMMDVIIGTGIEQDGERRYDDPDWRIDTLKDIAYDQFGYHPVTFGAIKTSSNGSLVPAETVLTHWDQLMTMQSIDRILWADRYSNTIQVSNITIEKFQVKDNPELSAEEKAAIPYTQISDHFGMSCLVQLV
ncbi:Endonuclease/exonuclease/phosphatase [Syncephalastrum racemosum]|uniref:Endonuclease/exonuclease/phosphatase n=1 Tax=Syncephalastrum racemosum TaxID=13706 RepID=A0A1X2H5S4_SYNRA|nr:Endonuclease/exonuclease/phosphatase [Syncephalastrum racemosum]